jgi:hypothetical protein
VAHTSSQCYLRGWDTHMWVWVQPLQHFKDLISRKQAGLHGLWLQSHLLGWKRWEETGRSLAWTKTAKQIFKKVVETVGQVVGHLPNKHKTLSSITSRGKKKSRRVNIYSILLISSKERKYTNEGLASVIMTCENYWEKIQNIMLSILQASKSLLILTQRFQNIWLNKVEM